MIRRRAYIIYVRRFAGVIFAVIGLTLVVKTVPFFFWSFFLGIILIWAGWQLYVYDQLNW